MKTFLLVFCLNSGELDENETDPSSCIIMGLSLVLLCTFDDASLISWSISHRILLQVRHNVKKLWVNSLSCDLEFIFLSWHNWFLLQVTYEFEWLLKNSAIFNWILFSCENWFLSIWHLFKCVEKHLDLINLTPSFLPRVFCKWVNNFQWLSSWKVFNETDTSIEFRSLEEMAESLIEKSVS